MNYKLVSHILLTIKFATKSTTLLALFCFIHNLHKLLAINVSYITPIFSHVLGLYIQSQNILTIVHVLIILSINIAN